MTAVAEVAHEPLFHSDLGLFPFQVDASASTYWRWTETDEPCTLLLYDTGIGKTVISIATLAMMIEDDLVDQVLVVAEANKVLDWVKVDFPRFAPRISVKAYSGDPKRRQKILDDPPQVLVTTYHTGRADLGDFKRVGKRQQRTRAWDHDGPLMDFMQGKRTAIVFDEFSVLRTRGSQIYMCWERLLKTLRKQSPELHPRIIGMTATTVEGSPEDHWNACRLLSPDRAGTVQQFENTYVGARSDVTNKVVKWNNITAADCEPGVIPLNRLFASITQVKRKSDDDVIDFFPKKVEEPPTMVHLSAKHMDLYRSVEDVYADPELDDLVRRQGFTLLRVLAGHPMGLINSQSQAARDIVAAVGAPYLETLEAAKVQAMIDWQISMGQQQTVIFTFFGQSILPLLAFRLRQEGYKISTNHGQQSKAEGLAQRQAFISGDNQIFLSSDAGAKGLNLGCGSALLHYESPILYSTFVQRSDRIHRIDSRHPSVTINTLIAKGTLEEPVTRMMLKRNDLAEKVQDSEWSEDYEPTEGFLRASDRLAMLNRAT